MLPRLMRAIVLSISFVYPLSIWPDGIAAEPSPRVYELNEIIALAIERNPVLASAEADHAERHGERIKAGSYPNPTILGQTGRASLRDPSSGDSRTELIVSLNQPVEWLGKRAARQAGAEAGLAAASAGIEEARLRVIAAAKIAFYELLLAQRELQIAKKNLSLVKEVARVATLRVKSGEAAPLESLKATVEMLQADQELKRTEKAVRVGRVRLGTVTGGALGRAFAIVGDFRMVDGEFDLDTLSGRAIELAPRIHRLQRHVAQATFAVAEQRQSRIPDVSIFGGYAREIGREAVIGGLSVPVPVWNQREGEIASALGAKRRKEAALFMARNDLLQSVAKHFQDVQTAVEQIDLYEKGLLRQAKEVLRIAQFSFRQGDANLLEVIDAQRVFQRVQLEYARVRLELSVALTRLEYSVGGVL